MLFNSYAFIFGFLPIVFIIFFVIGQYQRMAASLFLGLASLFFYAYWSVKALPLLIGSIIVNYFFGKYLTDCVEERRKFMLFCAVGFNLIVLATFKYANFFVDNANYILGATSLHPLNALNIMLPLGISFFTFTQIAFLVDCYEGKVRERNFTHYLLFVTYFPHLIAGPVLHHQQMMPQFTKKETYRPNYDNIAAGLIMFTIGLAKKVLIADQFAFYANGVFGAVTQGTTPSFYEAWAGALAFTFQIYFDFSGYSDMAIGLGKLFNIDLPINFNSPYKATSIIDFWRRWHISLSTFLKNYLYIPLGGNKKGTLRRYINLLATMLLGGLWHGANWTFVIWGGLHGFYLTINHVWRHFVPGGLHRFFPKILANLLGATLTFLGVVIAWVMFRATSYHEGALIIKKMFSFAEFANVKNLILVGPFNNAANMSGMHFSLLLILGAVWVWAFPNTQFLIHKKFWLLDRYHLSKGFGIIAAFVFFACIANFQHITQFIYFHF